MFIKREGVYENLIKNAGLYRIFRRAFSAKPALICFTVTRFITRFTTKQPNDDYNSLLLEVSETMQNLLWNLTLTSGQLLDQ